MTYIRPVPDKAQSERTRCNGTDFVTEERCENEATTFIKGGGKFCTYCSPPMTQELRNAIEAIHQAGLI